MERGFDSFAGLTTWHAAEHGDRISLLDRERAVTWAALHDEVERVAAGLARLGVGPGDRVALWLPDVPAWLVLFLACARLGAIAVAVNTRFRSAEVSDVVGRIGCKVLVCWPGFHGIDFASILADIPRAALPRLETVVLYTEDTLTGNEAAGFTCVSYGDLLVDKRYGVRAECNAPCIVFATSGTTRRPKFVLHDQATLLRHGRDVAQAFGYTAPDTVVLVGAPLCGVFGFCTAIAALCAGRPTVMTPVFDAAEIARLVTLHRVTHTNAANSAIAQVLACAGEARPPFPSVRTCGFASFSPGLEHLVEQADAQGVKLVGLYGSSELQALIARQPEDEPALMRRRAGGVLTAREGRVRAVDPVTRVVLPDGMPGELEFLLPSRMVEYLDDPTATRDAFSGDGYFRSGDFGYTLGGHRFVFLARLDDALRLAGILVSPAEIEAVVEELREVESCQVVGVDLPEGGTVAMAFVVPHAAERPQEAVILAHCRQRLAKFKTPTRVFVVDELPLAEGANAVKVRKGRLREIALQRLRAGT